MVRSYRSLPLRADGLDMTGSAGRSAEAYLELSGQSIYRLPYVLELGT